MFCVCSENKTHEVFNMFDF